MSDAQIDFYHVLQVHPKADSETITQVYRLLAKKYHPDTAPASLKSSYENKMKEINIAYAILCKPDAREEYDATNGSLVDINSYRVQFEIAAVLAETASAGGGQRLCYEQSGKILKGIIQNNTDQAVTYEAFVRLAQIQYHGLESYADAADSFDRLLDMTTDRDDRDELFFCIAECHIKRLARQDAVSTINRLLTECKDAEKIIASEVMRANLFRDMLDYERALDAYRIVTIKYPDSEEAAFCHFQRARILDSSLSRWHDAIAEYQIVMGRYSQFEWANDCKWRIDHIQRKHIDKKGWWE